MDAGGGDTAFLHDTAGATTADVSYDALLTQWRRRGLAAASAGFLPSTSTYTLIIPGQYEWSETAGDGGDGEPRLLRHHGTATYLDLLMDSNSGSQPPARPAPLYLISAGPSDAVFGAGRGGGGGFGGVPAAHEAVAALLATTYCGGQQGDEENECCAVCREEYVHGDALRTMPCKHGFHEACIFPWLRVSRLCPLCRFALPAHVAAEPDSPEEEEEDEEECEDGGDGGTDGDDDGEENSRLATSDS